MTIILAINVPVTYIIMSISHIQDFMIKFEFFMSGLTLEYYNCLNLTKLISWVYRWVLWQPIYLFFKSISWLTWRIHLIYNCIIDTSPPTILAISKG